MYSTNDVGSMAIYGVILVGIFGLIGLPGVGPVILGLIVITAVSAMLAK